MGPSCTSSFKFLVDRNVLLFEIRPPRGNNILETRDGSYNDKTVSHFNPSERNIIISVEPRRSYLFIERYILLSTKRNSFAKERFVSK